MTADQWAAVFITAGLFALLGSAAIVLDLLITRTPAGRRLDNFTDSIIGGRHE